MPRIHWIEEKDARGRLAELFDASRGGAITGVPREHVPDILHTMSHRPDFLAAIMDVYGGGPVGIEAVAATVNDDAETLSEIVEPYLLKIGFLAREPRGRRVTREAYVHVGKQPPLAPTSGQSTLF